jgi:hypothetical protein
MERCYPCFFSLWATVSFSLFRCSGRIRSVTIETFAYDQFLSVFAWLLAVLFERLRGRGAKGCRPRAGRCFSLIFQTVAVACERATKRAAYRVQSSTLVEPPSIKSLIRLTLSPSCISFNSTGEKEIHRIGADCMRQPVARCHRSGRRKSNWAADEYSSADSDVVYLRTAPVPAGRPGIWAHSHSSSQPFDVVPVRRRLPFRLVSLKNY